MPPVIGLPIFTRCLFAVALGLSITAMAGTAGAREPGTLVVELAVADDVPPPCADLAFRGDVLFLKRDLMDRILISPHVWVSMVDLSLS